MKPLVLIGYDTREDLAYRVCRESILRYTQAVDVWPLAQEPLRLAGMYRRPAFLRDDQQYDALDLKPFSTEFSFTRFLAPLVGGLANRDYVLFVDSDFLFRANVRALLEHADSTSTVQVVKHEYRPHETSKMRGHVAQQGYSRKLWSALMLCNVRRWRLTPYQVNMMAGSWLHGFQWLSDQDIGDLPESWHWIPGHSAPDDDPSAVHYTLGTPDVEGMRDQPYASEWLQIAEEVLP